MPKLYELIQSEYKTEYIGEYQKSEGLMEKRSTQLLRFILKLSLKNA